MEKFKNKIEKKFAFLKLHQKEFKASNNSQLGHTALLYFLDNPYINIAFYQDLDRYQVQLIPKNQKKNNFGFDAPVILWVISLHEEFLNPKTADISNSIEKYWNKILISLNSENIENTTNQVKIAKKKYFNV